MRRLIRRHGLTAAACVKHLLIVKPRPLLNLVRPFAADTNRMVPVAVLRLVEIPTRRPLP